MRGGNGAKVSLPPPVEKGAKFKRLERGNGGRENGYQSLNTHMEPPGMVLLYVVPAPHR